MRFLSIRLCVLACLTFIYLLLERSRRVRSACPLGRCSVCPPWATLVPPKRTRHLQLRRALHCLDEDQCSQIDIVPSPWPAEPLIQNTVAPSIRRRSATVNTIRNDLSLMYIFLYTFCACHRNSDCCCIMSLPKQEIHTFSYQ